MFVNRTSLNHKARQKIAEISQRLNLTRCEAKLTGCMGEAHAPAHRHKRRWYYDKPDEMLWDINQWIGCCQACHQEMEYNEETNKRVFEKNRESGSEEIEKES